MANSKPYGGNSSFANRKENGKSGSYQGQRPYKATSAKPADKPEVTSAAPVAITPRPTIAARFNAFKSSFVGRFFGRVVGLIVSLIGGMLTGILRGIVFFGKLVTGKAESASMNEEIGYMAFLLVCVLLIQDITIAFALGLVAQVFLEKAAERDQHFGRFTRSILLLSILGTIAEYLLAVKNIYSFNGWSFWVAIVVVNLVYLRSLRVKAPVAVIADDPAPVKDELPPKKEAAPEEPENNTPAPKPDADIFDKMLNLLNNMPEEKRPLNRQQLQSKFEQANRGLEKLGDKPVAEKRVYKWLEGNTQEWVHNWFGLMKVITDYIGEINAEIAKRELAETVQAPEVETVVQQPATTKPEMVAEEQPKAAPETTPEEDAPMEALPREFAWERNGNALWKGDVRSIVTTMVDTLKLWYKDGKPVSPGAIFYQGILPAFDEEDLMASSIENAGQIVIRFANEALDDHKESAFTDAGDFKDYRSDWIRSVRNEQLKLLDAVPA